MDPVQLRTFLAIVEAGSFSAAAVRLNAAQSNVTARMRKLEAALGGAVFERSKAGARLTPLGERLVGHAREILATIAHAEADLRDAAGGAAPLRLGAVDTTAGTRLPPILAALHRAMPRAEVSLATATAADLVRAVWERRLDAALVVAPVDAARFRSVPAFVERLVEVRRAATDDADTLLAFRDGCSYRAATREWLRETGRNDTPVRDLGSFDAILGCVAAGMGFAVAPEIAVRSHRAAASLAIRPLGNRFERSETVLIWRNDTRPTRSLEALTAQLNDGAGA